MRLFVVGVMLIVVPFALAVENSPRPTPSIEEAKPKIEEAQLDKAKTRENQPVVEAVQGKPGACQHDANNQTDKQKTDPAKPVDYQWWFNLFLVILTGGLVITGALQVRVYREQARFMREGLEVTKQSAKAAQDSADVAGRALEVVERASLFVENWTYNICHGNQVPAGLFCTLHNTGRTAATLTEGAVCLDVCEGMPFRPEFESLSPTYKGPFTVQVQETLEHRLPFTAERWKEVKATIHGNWEIYLYGYITYTDEFRGRHHIRFCLKGERGGQLIPVGEGGYNYHVTEKKKNIE